MTRSSLLFVFAATLLAGHAVSQTYPIFQADGLTTPERFGEAVAVTGDLDRDRVADLAVGVRLGAGGGQVRVFDALTGVPLLAIPGTSGLVAPSGLTVFELGTRLAAQVHDGCTRLLAGAPASGVIGTPSIPSVGTTLLAWLAPARLLDGGVANEEFGAAVANVGDVDGDLFPDFLVGAPGTTLDPNVIGRAVLLSGRSGGVLRVHNGDRRAHERFGATLAGLGDIDGDLVPDYAIGDPDAFAGGTGAGQVRVFSGATGALVRTLDGAPNDGFGSTLCGAGRSPQGSLLAVAAPLADLSGGRRAFGYVKVFVAQTGALRFTLEGIRAEQFGFALAIGNSAADTLLGAHDLLVGVPRATVGAVAAAGQVRAFSLRDGSLVRTIPNPSPATDDRFGSAVASASFGAPGDRPFAVGALNSGANDQGIVWVMSSAGAVITTIAGLGNAAGTGSTLACIGDVDGDAQPDYAVGSFTLAHGHVRVHSGVDGRSLGHLFVGNPTFRLGSALCGAGDPTSDAYRFGLVVGVPGADRVQTTAMVETSFRRGPSPDVAPTSNARSGAAVAFVGDVDADGTPDFAIGAPGEIDNGIGRQGRATVFSGRNGAALWSVDGAGQHDGLGDAIAGPGDLNGDGIPDVAIGATRADASGSLIDSGAVQIVSGVDGSPIRTLLGGEAGEHFGAALAALGDVDGDGVGDLACGAPDFDGLVGADRGRVRFASGASGVVLRTIAGSTLGEAFGASLAATGDLDGDARSELLVGAPRADVATSDQGRVDLLSGATGARVLLIAGQNLSFARLGDGLAAGDLDGDCLPDLVVGAPGGGPGRVRALSRFGVPQGSSRFGLGCPGSLGVFPLIETFGGTPFSVGVPEFGISLSCAASNAPALLMVGFSDTNWGSVLLPFDATPLGFAGCSVLVSGDVLFSAATNGGGAGLGRAMVPMPIPADNSLTGLVLFAQWIVVDAGAPNGMGAMSPGLRIVVQQVP